MSAIASTNSLLPVATAQLALRFTDRCKTGASSYRLFEGSDTTIYAACFACYIRHLLRTSTDDFRGRIEPRLRERRRALADSEVHAKGYRQLLAFSLSALATVGELASSNLEDLIEEQIQGDVTHRLRACGALEGRPQSGNEAMFLAIFLLHARDRLGMNAGSKIDEWVERHLESMNRFGFWGSPAAMTHLQFQNGYHQHEILEYLGVHNPRERETLRAVGALADREGHFAPYPGGGGCFDYDAVFLLTPNGNAPQDPRLRALLVKTAATIACEQNDDGGFGESRQVRPRSLDNLARFAGHVATALPSWPLFSERLFYALNLQRRKHDRIQTHWTARSRGWAESNLWDTWFRLLTLARIETALNPGAAAKWGFIDYPGIGFHPSLRSGWGAPRPDA